MLGLNTCPDFKGISRMLKHLLPPNVYAGTCLTVIDKAILRILNRPLKYSQPVHVPHISNVNLIPIH